MTQTELHTFVNALRDCLGLAPLYDRMRIEGREYEFRPDRYINFSHYMGDGNRRVGVRPAEHQIKLAEHHPEKAVHYKAP